MNHLSIHFRGYAANCRVKRDDEEEVLLEQIEGHEKTLEALAKEKQQLELDYNHLRQKMAREEQGGNLSGLFWAVFGHTKIGTEQQ